QPLKTMNPEAWIDDRAIIGSHFRSAHGMENGCSNVAGGACQFLVAFDVRTRLELLRPIARECRLTANAACQANGISGNSAIFFSRKIVRPDLRMRCRVGRLYPNVPAARRPQVANARRKGRKRIERFTELWQCQRLDVILQVGRLTARI